MLEKLLIEKIKKGDTSTFELLFKTYHPDLVRYATGIVGSVSDAEDLVEDCFYWIWEERHSIHVRKSIRSFLFSIVYNKCLNHLKKKKVHKNYEEHVKIHYLKKEINYPDTNLVSKELSKSIQQAIESLPEQCRFIFKLSRYEGKKYEEIAEMLNISINTVKKQMNRAITKLREDLSEYLNNK